MAVHEQQVVRIYASRAMAFALGVLGGGAFVFADVLLYLAPTPAVTAHPWEYQEPFKTILFVVCLLLFGIAVLAGLYWTVTPVPLLQLDAMGMVYQPYPFVKRSVYWADISDISASKTSATVNLVRIISLTLWFHIKPHAVLTYGGKAEFKWRIGQRLLPIPVEDVVHRIQRYHEVTDIDQLIHEFRRASGQSTTGHGTGNEEGAGQKQRARRRLTTIVIALFIGWLLCSAGIVALLASIFNLQGGALDLISLLFSLVSGWLFFSLLRRYALRGLGRCH